MGEKLGGGSAFVFGLLNRHRKCCNGHSRKWKKFVENALQAAKG